MFPNIALPCVLKTSAKNGLATIHRHLRYMIAITFLRLLKTYEQSTYRESRLTKYYWRNLYYARFDSPNGASTTYFTAVQQWCYATCSGDRYVCWMYGHLFYWIKLTKLWMCRFVISISILPLLLLHWISSEDSTLRATSIYGHHSAYVTESVLQSFIVEIL